MGDVLIWAFGFVFGLFLVSVLVFAAVAFVCLLTLGR